MATMRLRCIHSCMVLTVVGLLLVYSAFLTSPSYVDSTLDGGETSGSFSVNSTLIKLTSNAQTEVQGASFPLAEQLSQFDLPISLPQNASSAVEVSKNAHWKTEEDHKLLLSSQRDKDALANSAVNPNGQVVKRTPIASKLKSLPSANNPKNAVWTKDIYEPGFSYSNPQVCPNDGLDTRLVILITSAPGHFSARDAIRLTWGHYSQRIDVSIAFLIGKTENETILEGIEVEKHLYDDLVVANFMDSYDNLTLKTMSALEWIDTYCNQSQFVLKTDDDMFINVPNLLTFIDKIEEGDKKQPKLYGRLARKWKPVRNKKSKYYISFQQHRKTAYPDFTTGPAYLFSTRLVRPLFEKGMEKTYLKLEDVYTTGIVAQELKTKRMNIAEFANKKVNFHKTGFCALSRLISMHMVAYHEQFELWKKILDGRTKCKIIYTNKNKDNSNNNSPVQVTSNNASNAIQNANNNTVSGGSVVSVPVPGPATVINSSSSSSSSSSVSTSSNGSGAMTGVGTTNNGGMVSSSIGATLTSEQSKKK